MGKATRKKKRAQRFDPLARPDAAMQVDEEDAAESPKISAHKARHIERKRLQAEAKALKKQRTKVSKADKLTWKSEKKAITKALKAVKGKAAALRQGPLVMPTSSSSEADHALGAAVQRTSADAPAFSGFDLPMPARQSAPLAGFT